VRQISHLCAVILTKLNSFPMKRNLLRWAFCLLFFPVTNVWSQDTKTAPGTVATQGQDASSTKTPDTTQAAPMFPDSVMRNYDVEVFQNVLKMADLVRFQYKDAVAKSKSGEIASMYKLLDFHRVVDGVDALNHAVTCLELIPLAGDQNFAAAVSICQPKLKTLLLERLMLAQARTKKTFLRQSLTNWAPVTWEYLNGRTVELKSSKPVQEPVVPMGLKLAPPPPPRDTTSTRRQ
jgi:hypothetical protein